MRIRFYNAQILTMDPNMDIINGELWVENSFIEYIGQKKEYKEDFDKEIDAKNNLLMPGFKNAHTHCPMTFARSYADDLALGEWLETKIFPMEAKLTGEHVYYFSKLAYMEYLTSGITAAFNMYYEPEDIVKASVESGFRTVLCGAINNFKESPEILEDYFNKYNNHHELISYKLGFHAEYTTNLSIMKQIAELAKKYKAPVYVHNSETKLEVDNCIKKYGKTPTRLFNDIGLYTYGGGGFHCIYLDEKDIEIFRRNNLFAIINSASNSKLASGIAPVYNYMINNMNLALGTDGASSNNALDMFREMYLTAVLQKILVKDASICQAFEVLHMATVGGAKAMGLDNCDILAVGKKADIIMIDLYQPNMQPMNNVINNLVYSGSKQNVKMTMINGKILYENGYFYTIDQDIIYRKTNQMMKSLT